MRAIFSLPHLRGGSVVADGVVRAVLLALEARALDGVAVEVAHIGQRLQSKKHLTAAIRNNITTSFQPPPQSIIIIADR